MRRSLLRISLLCVVMLGLVSTPHPYGAQGQPATPLDLNTATPDQLRSLPGMGIAYVRRVIAARPYTAKNQLVTRGVLPASAYDQIKDRIVAHRQKAPPTR
jgi:competence protein ComEA